MRNQPQHAGLYAAILAGLLAGCSGSDDASVGTTVNTETRAQVCGVGGLVDFPDDFPEPEIPCDNRLTAAKIQLGRFLFYDRDMSFNRTQSCSDCHQQDKAFTDSLATSVGSGGDIHPRNAMSMTNVIYNGTQNWANPSMTGLEQQALAVLLNEDPVELGWSGNEAAMLERFRSASQDPVAGRIDYPAMFASAFPDAQDPYTIFKVSQALAAFGATMVSGDSAFDREQRGEAGAMSDAAQRGRELFFSERLECFHCHSGFNFSDSVDHTGLQFTQNSFHNNGLYNVDIDGDGISDNRYPPDNPGLRESTLEEADDGKFRAPTLRNIELTSPYMHDGSLATLDDVIDHYARGGRLITVGPYAGDGSLNANKSSFINGFVLTANERLDLKAFLESLTDWSFICDTDLSDPFGNIPMHPGCP